MTSPDLRRVTEKILWDAADGKAPIFSLITTALQTVQREAREPLDRANALIGKAADETAKEVAEDALCTILKSHFVSFRFTESLVQELLMWRRTYS